MAPKHEVLGKRRKETSRNMVPVLAQQSGITIVSVMVAFVILLLLISGFESVIRMTSDLMAESERLRQEAVELQESFYLGTGDLQTEETVWTEKLIFTGDGSFSLPCTVHQLSSEHFDLYEFLLAAQGGAS